MTHSKRFRFTLGLFLTAGMALTPPLRAQDDKEEKDKKAAQELLQKAEDEYRLYFKRPEKVFEFWAAMKFEMETGKFDLAAFHLGQMLQLPAEDADKELLKIERIDGMNAFLRLQTVRRWNKNDKLQQEAEKNVKTLIDRVTAALEKHLGDAERINKFIKQLDAATPEERAFAFAELQRSRTRAAPYILQALRTSVGTPLFSRLQDALMRLDDDIVPPLLEVLKAANDKDALDPDVRPLLIDLFKRRADKRVIPYLWHLSEAKQYPEPVRAKARATLAYLSETELALLPPAKMALADLAERYYYHRVKFKPGVPIRVWPWNGQTIPTKPTELTPAQAEEYYGLRYAREALDLDPTYLPAQRVLLSLTLERSFNRELDQFLLKPFPPAQQRLLATIDIDLISTVLEKALDDGNIAVILPCVYALGERGDTQAARLSALGTPRGLMRALYYPDRRVQYTTLQALLKLPTGPGASASLRIVDLLRRFVAADAKPKALILFMPDDQIAGARKAFKDLELEPVAVKTVHEAFEKLKGSADYDAIFLGTALLENDLPFVMTQLRGDADHGRLPLVLFAPKEKQDSFGRIVERHRFTKVLPETFLQMPEDLKLAWEGILQEGLSRLTAAERKELNRVAMDKLVKMARGEIAGYDVRPAQDAMIGALRNPDLAMDALEILGRLPNRRAQTELASVVLDAGKDKLRKPAALELNRSVQKFGVLLEKNQVAELKLAYKNAKDDDPLRSQLALFLGNLRTTPTATGQQLIQFRPDPPPPEKKEKEKEKEKDKDGD